jgi:tetratricopeptide (TPR) repeat protein
MAIEKVESKKTEWTKPTLLQLGVAGGIAAVSLVVAYFAFVNWRFKANLVSGYELYDQGQITGAQQDLEAAVGWKPSQPGARELLAKIYCDTGKLDKAEEQYKVLIAQGVSEPEVRASLGVVYLKKADRAKESKDVVTWVKQAQDEFTAAGEGVPEAAIGMGHGELLLAAKLNDPKHLAEAAKFFKKTREAMENREYRAKITRDGLIDYYSGLGKVLSSGATYDPAAAVAFKVCSLYAPRWTQPRANVLALEARRFAESTKETAESLAAVEKETTALRNDMGNMWKKSRDLEETMRDPWMMYVLSLAKAYARAGKLDKHDQLYREVIDTGKFADSPLPHLIDARILCDLAPVEEPFQEKVVIDAIQVLETRLLRTLTAADPESKDKRARTLNALAWMKAWRGESQNRDDYRRMAKTHLEDAIKLFPDDYVYNRNLLLVLKRIKGTPPSALAPYLEKAKAGAKGDQAQDFAKVQQYLEAK